MPKNGRKNVEEAEGEFRRFMLELLSVEAHESAVEERRIFSFDALKRILGKFCDLIADHLRCDSCTIQLQLYDYSQVSQDTQHDWMKEYFVERGLEEGKVKQWLENPGAKEESQEYLSFAHRKRNLESYLTFPYWRFGKGLSLLMANKDLGPWNPVLLKKEENLKYRALEAGVTLDIYQENTARVRDRLTMRGTRGLRKLGRADIIVWNNLDWNSMFHTYYGVPIRIHSGGEVVGLLKVENKLSTKSEEKKTTEQQEFKPPKPEVTVGSFIFGDKNSNASQKFKPKDDGQSQRDEELSDQLLLPTIAKNLKEPEHIEDLNCSLLSLAYLRKDLEQCKDKTLAECLFLPYPQAIAEARKCFCDGVRQLFTETGHILSSDADNNRDDLINTCHSIKRVDDNVLKNLKDRSHRFLRLTKILLFSIMGREQLAPPKHEDSTYAKKSPLIESFESLRNDFTKDNLANLLDHIIGQYDKLMQKGYSSLLLKQDAKPPVQLFFTSIKAEREFLKSLWKHRCRRRRKRRAHNGEDGHPAEDKGIADANRDKPRTQDYTPEDAAEFSAKELLKAVAVFYRFTAKKFRNHIEYTVSEISQKVEVKRVSKQTEGDPLKILAQELHKNYEDIFPKPQEATDTTRNDKDEIQPWYELSSSQPDFHFTIETELKIKPEVESEDTGKEMKEEPVVLYACVPPSTSTLACMEKQNLTVAKMYAQQHLFVCQQAETSLGSLVKKRDKYHGRWEKKKWEHECRGELHHFYGVDGYTKRAPLRVTDLLHDRLAARMQAFSMACPVPEFGLEDTHKLTWAAFEIAKLIERQITYRGNRSEDPMPLTAMEFCGLPISDMSFVDDLRGRRKRLKEVGDNIDIYLKDVYSQMDIASDVDYSSRIKDYGSYFERLRERFEAYFRGNIAVWVYLLSLHPKSELESSGLSEIYNDLQGFRRSVERLDFRAQHDAHSSVWNEISKGMSQLYGDLKFDAPPFLDCCNKQPEESSSDKSPLPLCSDMEVRGKLWEALYRVSENLARESVHLTESFAKYYTRAKQEKYCLIQGLKAYIRDHSQEFASLLLRDYSCFSRDALSFFFQLANRLIDKCDESEPKEKQTSKEKSVPKGWFAEFYRSCYNLRIKLCTPTSEMRETAEGRILSHIFGLGGMNEEPSSTWQNIYKFISEYRTNKVFPDTAGRDRAETAAYRHITLTPKGIYKRIRTVMTILKRQRPASILDWELGKFDLYGARMNCLFKNQVFALYENIWNKGDPFFQCVLTEEDVDRFIQDPLLPASRSDRGKEDATGEKENPHQRETAKCEPSKHRKRWLCLRTSPQSGGYTSMHITALVDGEFARDGYWEDERRYDPRKIQYLMGRLFSKFELEEARKYCWYAYHRHMVSRQYANWFRDYQRLVRHAKPQNKSIKWFGSFVFEGIFDMLMILVYTCIDASRFRGNHLRESSRFGLHRSTIGIVNSYISETKSMVGPGKPGPFMSVLERIYLVCLFGAKYSAEMKNKLCEEYGLSKTQFRCKEHPDVEETILVRVLLDSDIEDLLAYYCDEALWNRLKKDASQIGELSKDRTFQEWLNNEEKRPKLFGEVIERLRKAKKPSQLKEALKQLEKELKILDTIEKAKLKQMCGECGQDSTEDEEDKKVWYRPCDFGLYSRKSKCGLYDGAEKLIGNIEEEMKQEHCERLIKKVDEEMKIEYAEDLTRKIVEDVKTSDQEKSIKDTQALMEVKDAKQLLRKILKAVTERGTEEFLKMITREATGQDDVVSLVKKIVKRITEHDPEKLARKIAEEAKTQNFERFITKVLEEANVENPDEFTKRILLRMNAEDVGALLREIEGDVSKGDAEGCIRKIQEEVEEEVEEEGAKILVKRLVDKATEYGSEKLIRDAQALMNVKDAGEVLREIIKQVRERGSKEYLKRAVEKLEKDNIVRTFVERIVEVLKEKGLSEPDVQQDIKVLRRLRENLVQEMDFFVNYEKHDCNTPLFFLDSDNERSPDFHALVNLKVAIIKLHTHLGTKKPISEDCWFSVYRTLRHIRREQKSYLFTEGDKGTKSGLWMRDKANVLARLKNYTLLFSREKDVRPGDKPMFAGWNAHDLYYYLRSLIPVEIQVRTKLVDTFAEQYHDAVYKQTPPLGTELPCANMIDVGKDIDKADRELEIDYEDYALRFQLEQESRENEEDF